MTIKSRWRKARLQFSLPNALIALVVLGIIIFAGIDAVKKGYISSTTAIYLACFIPAVIFHEVSHGVVALWFGDDTAKRAGRLTLNPLRHIDPIGTILLPIILVITAGIPFGYAKPVPVSVNRLRHPRNDAVLVGLAGPVTNILLASLGGLYLHFTNVRNVFDYGGALYVQANLSVAQRFALAFGLVNIALAAFNLIPIPPLDGSALIERLIPDRLIPQYYQMRFFFMIVVLLFVLTQQSLLERWLSDAQYHFLRLFVG